MGEIILILAAIACLLGFYLSIVGASVCVVAVALLITVYRTAADYPLGETVLLVLASIAVMQVVYVFTSLFLAPAIRQRLRRIATRNGVRSVAQSAKRKAPGDQRS